MSRSLFLLLITQLCFITAYSQENCQLTLQGNVLDNHTNEAIFPASIYIRELEEGIATDVNGHYLFKNLCPGTYTIDVQHIGYDRLSFQLQLTSDTTLPIRAEIHATDLDQIEITDRNNHHASATSTIDLETIERSAGKPIANALSSIAGVQTINMGSSVSKPVIHGMHSNRVLLINNGIRHESQQWGNDHAPEIDPFLVNQLKVIKGANSVLYGSDAIAGVVLITPSPLRTENGIDGKIQSALVSNGKMGAISSTVNGKHKLLVPLSWRVQGTLKKGGNTHTPDYYLSNTGLEEANFSAALGYQNKLSSVEVFYSQFNSNVAIFSGAHIGNLSDLQDAFAGNSPKDSVGFDYKINRAYQHIEHELIKFKAKSFLNENNKLQLVYSRQFNLRSEYDKHGSSTTTESSPPELKFTITTNTADLLWENYSIEHSKSVVGVSGVFQQNKFTGRYFIPNFQSEGIGFYGYEKWHKNNLELEAGIRYDIRNTSVYFNDGITISENKHNYDNLSFNFGSIFHFAHHFEISLHSGYAWRAPAIIELYAKGVHHGAAAVENGNPNLPKEIVKNIQINLHQQTSRLDFELTAYYNLFDAYIYAKPEAEPTLTVRGAFPTYSYSSTRANFYGIDLFFVGKISKKLIFKNSSAWVEAKDLSNSSYLPNIPALRIKNTLALQFDSIGKINKPNFEIHYMNVSKQKRYNESSDFTAPPKAYSLLSASISFEIGNSERPIRFGIEAENLLNQRYRDYLNRFRYYSDELGRSYTLRFTIPIN